MKEIFERQGCILRLTHRRATTLEEQVPSKVTWSLHDAASGDAIKEDQEITGIISHIVDIEIASVNNAILNNSNSEEIKVATIRSEFSGGSLATKEFSYKVKNMTYWIPV